METASTPIDRDTVAARVAGFPRLIADRADLTQAAVAVCVTVHDGLPCLLLTRRAAGLRAHAGQWALPGGRRDAGETATEARCASWPRKSGSCSAPTPSSGCSTTT